MRITPMLCILYVTAVGLLLGIIGDLLERLRPADVARRWIWCAVMIASVALPGYYRYHHAVAVGEANSVGLAVDLPSRISAYDGMIGSAWQIAMAVLAAWAVINAGWISVLLRRSRGTTSTVIGVTPAIITDGLGPATVGVWRSRVVLPRWVLALPNAQRDYIVRHEDEHRRSRDCALLFLASLSVILIPWNAALWWQLRRLSLAVEMDCDARVVDALGDPHAYSSLLFTVAQASRGRPRLQPGLLGATGMLEHRLATLLAPASPRRITRVLMPVVAALLLLLVLKTPHPVLGHAHSPAAMTSSSQVAGHR